MSIDGPLGATPRSGGFELPAALSTAPPLQSVRAAARGRLGLLALGSLVACTLTVCIAATGTDSLLPESIRAPGAIPGLDGLFGSLHVHFGAGLVLGLLTLLFASYVFVVRSAERLSPRVVLLAIAGVTALVVLAPPLMSTDVFSYEAYARVWQIYGANPYLTGPHVMYQGPLLSDTLYSFVDSKWFSTPTAYGPIFTALSGLVGSATGGFGTYSSIVTGAFVFKGIAAICSLGTVALVWHAARLRGLDPVRATAIVGLNPLVVLYGVGGGHNDLLMLLLTTAGLWAVLAHRERTSGAMIVLGAAVKLTGLILLPFAYASGVALGARRRHRAIALGALLAGLACVVLGGALFGAGPLELPVTLSKVQSEGDGISLSGLLTSIHGLSHVGHVVGLGFAVLFVGVCAWLLVRVWRGRMDWIDGAGWATFTLLVTASALLAWYVAWLLPLAALCTDRRLTKAALWLTGAVQLVTMLSYLPHPFLGL